MVRAILNKLRKASGESLGETAASLLVVSMAMLMLAGSVVSSGEINKTADETAGLAGAGKQESSAAITLSYESGDATASTSTVTVDMYNADGLYYYELPNAEANS